MPEKKNLVAIVIGNNGCEHIAKVKQLNDQDLAKLKNELEYNNTKKLEKENFVDDRLKAHERDISHLYNKDFLLAKAIYDRAVDRGYIDENKDFDKAYYDFIFEDKPLDSKLFPDEFKKILERVEKL